MENKYLMVLDEERFLRRSNSTCLVALTRLTAFCMSFTHPARNTFKIFWILPWDEAELVTGKGNSDSTLSSLFFLFNSMSQCISQLTNSVFQIGRTKT